MYESEHTCFMRELFEKKPELAAEQQRGRAIWWDRPAQSPEDRRRAAQARVKQKAYPYQV